MSQHEMQTMMRLLSHAPWAEWSTQSIDGAPAKALAKPGSEAMNKAQESLDALQAVSAQMKTIYRQCQTGAIAKEGGSTPSLLKVAMTKVKELEDQHLEPIADLRDGHDGQGISVKDLKGVLNVAAPAMAIVNQHMNEIKVLVNRHKAAAAKRDTDA